MKTQLFVLGCLLVLTSALPAERDTDEDSDELVRAAEMLRWFDASLEDAAFDARQDDQGVTPTPTDNDNNDGDDANNNDNNDDNTDDGNGNDDDSGDAADGDGDDNSEIDFEILAAAVEEESENSGGDNQDDN